MARATLSDRFWKKVDRRQAGECWPWTASLHDKGYGQIYLAEAEGESRKEFAHRVAWLLTSGSIPEGLHVLHKCDNRSCCNPEHLFLGTNGDNVADKVKKGRQEKGSAHTCAKLTEDQVRAIRRDTRTLQVIADQYGVHNVTVLDAKAGRTWKHVT